jgi:maltose/maltodextrin transport system substrate-binding protein
MKSNVLLAVFVFLSAIRAFSWTEGELLIWLSDNRGFRSWEELGKKFEQEMGVPVRVETQEQITEKFQAAAQGGKGPDIFLWAHDRIGEWAEAGLLKPLEIKEDFKAAFIPMSWDAVAHNKQTWGYPVALECVSLIVNKKLVTGKPPAQLSEFPAFAKELKAKDPKLIAIMWDYKTPYFGFPFLASAGAYTFRRTESGYDIKDIGVDNAGAIEGLKAIVDLINAGVLPKGSTQNVGEQKMATGELATMVNGPGLGPIFVRAASISISPVTWGWRKSSKLFVGVLTAFINRSSPNADFAMQFLEKFVCTADGLRAIDADAPLGVPAVKALADEMSAKDPLIKGTYENILNGVVMPNIPQMGKLWSSMKAAFETATNGDATPEAALRDARKNLEK